MTRTKRTQKPLASKPFKTLSHEALAQVTGGLSNGLSGTNGLSAINGLSSINGLS